MVFCFSPAFKNLGISHKKKSVPSCQSDTLPLLRLHSFIIQLEPHPDQPLLEQDLYQSLGYCLHYPLFCLISSTSHHITDTFLIPIAFEFVILRVMYLPVLCNVTSSIFHMPSALSNNKNRSIMPCSQCITIFTSYWLLPKTQTACKKLKPGSIKRLAQGLPAI